MIILVEKQKIKHLVEWLKEVKAVLRDKDKNWLQCKKQRGKTKCYIYFLKVQILVSSTLLAELYLFMLLPRWTRRCLSDRAETLVLSIHASADRLKNSSWIFWQRLSHKSKNISWVTKRCILCDSKCVAVESAQRELKQQQPMRSLQHSADRRCNISVNLSDVRQTRRSAGDRNL